MALDQGGRHGRTSCLCSMAASSGSPRGCHRYLEYKAHNAWWLVCKIRVCEKALWRYVAHCVQKASERKEGRIKYSGSDYPGIFEFQHSTVSFTDATIIG